MVSFSAKTAPSIIANEKMGFRFGTPERPDENSLSVVLPILRQTSLKRHYLTLVETEEVEISDTGSIHRMKFTNNSKENIFVRSGTILKGSTQERAVTRSAILFPGKSAEIEVRCVHQSRGIQRGAMVKHGGITPLDFDQMNYTANYAASDQHTYWRSAEMYSRTVSSRMSHSERGSTLHPTAASLRHSTHHHGRLGSPQMGAYPVMDSAMPRQDDLASNLDEFANNFSELLSKIKLHENQVGLGLISEKGCETIELFDVPLSWKALHGDAVKRLGSNVSKQDPDKVFQYKPEKAIEAVKSVLGAGFDQKTLYEHRASNGEPSVAVISLSNERYTGEIVELDERVVHLVLLRMVKVA